MKRTRQHRPFTPGRILRPARIVISLLFLALCCLLFASANARIALALGWVARIQIIPLALSTALTAVGVWLVATLVFGRVYCSSVCPMGALQDFAAWIPRRRRKWKRRHPYHFTPANNRLRYLSLLTILGCFLCGLSAVPSLLDPFAGFGRIASELALPVVEAIGGKEVVVGSLTAFLTATATLAGIATASWKRGRLFCNTLCPAGNLLSLPARYSLFHFDIDTDRCVNCRACEHVCKAQCISMDDHTVDSSRCVVCFNCIDICREDAIRYTTTRKRLSIPMLQRVETAPNSALSTPEAAGAGKQASKTETGPQQQPSASTAVKIDRRQFLATGLLVAATPALTAIAGAADKGAYTGSGRRQLRPIHYVAPPGRKSMSDFLDKCTGCGLCVAHCPTHALKPSSNQFGWIHALRPAMDYDRGSCLYDCTLCTRLCPTGALTTLTTDEKHIFIIGHARVEPANCIGCGKCVRACPRHAISMKPRQTTPAEAGNNSHTSRRVASVDTSGCIGCGACQNICPARPYKAIIVDGII